MNKFFLLLVVTFCSLKINAQSKFNDPTEFYNIPTTYSCDQDNPYFDTRVNSHQQPTALRYNAWKLFLGINSNFLNPKEIKTTPEYIPRWGTWLGSFDIRDYKRTYQTLPQFCAASSNGIYSIKGITLPASFCDATKVDPGVTSTAYEKKLTAYLENHWANLNIARQATDNSWKCNGRCLVSKAHSSFVFKNKALGSGLLVDRHGSEVFFETRYNPVINQAYLSQFNDVTHTKTGYFFPQGSCPNKDKTANDRWDIIDYHPSISIQIAWKVLNKHNNKNHFFTLKDVQPKHLNKTVDLGMVGMIIAMKDTNYTNWRWAVFSHKNNVESSGDTEALFSYDNDSILFKNAYITHSAKEAKDITYKDVISPVLSREKPIPSEVKQLNDHFQKWLKKQHSVLSHYELIDVQFVSNATKKKHNSEHPKKPPTSSHTANKQNAIQPENLRSVVLEPYLLPPISQQCEDKKKKARYIKQTIDDDIRYYHCNKKPPVHGCIGCHTDADASGQDFLFGINKFKNNLTQTGEKK